MKTIQVLIIGLKPQPTRTSAYEAALRRANELKDHAVAMARDAWANVTAKEEFPQELLVVGDTIEIIFSNKARTDRSFSTDGRALIQAVKSDSITFKLIDSRVFTSPITLKKQDLVCRLVKAA